MSRHALAGLMTAVHTFIWEPLAGRMRPTSFLRKPSNWRKSWVFMTSGGRACRETPLRWRPGDESSGYYVSGSSVGSSNIRRFR